MKGEGWQGIGLPALWANVMVCGYYGCFVFFWVGLFGQGLDFLWLYRSAVDAHIVNQAGPERPCFHSLAGANVQAVF
jgi:hypothetical protein